MNRPSAVRRRISQRNRKRAGADDDARRHGEELAGADRRKEVAAEGDDQTLVDQQRDAAARDHQNQRRDDRLDVEDGDQEAVPQSAQQARARASAREPGAATCRGGSDWSSPRRRWRSPRRPRDRCPWCRSPPPCRARPARSACRDRARRSGCRTGVPATMRIEKNPGDTTPSTMKISARATIGQNQARLVRSPSRPSAGRHRLRTVRVIHISRPRSYG